MTTPFFRFLVYTRLPMGRQTRFHMLPEDCRRFVLFLRERDPVIVTDWHSSELAEIQEVSRPWERGGHYCLWNQAILPALTGKRPGSISISTFRRLSLNSPMNLLCSNLGTVNLRLRRVESGPVSKPRIKLLRSGTTLSSDGFARTLFVTSRWDTIGIQSVLRRTNGSEPAVCSFPIFDLR